MARKSMKKRGGGNCGAPLMGGKRRSRKMKGGMYGVDTKAAPIGPGALPWGAAYTGNADPNTGGALPDPALPGGQFSGIGGRRRTRKTRKGGKHRRGHRGTRKMKGGAGSVSAQKAGYGYTGTGAGGLADATYTPTSGGNAF